MEYKEILKCWKFYDYKKIGYSKILLLNLFYCLRQVAPGYSIFSYFCSFKFPSFGIQCTMWLDYWFFYELPVVLIHGNNSAKSTYHIGRTCNIDTHIFFKIQPLPLPHNMSLSTYNSHSEYFVPATFH